MKTAAAAPAVPAVKYSGARPPATLRAWCEAHPHIVYELHCGGGYATERPDGFAYDVMLRGGWRMSDDLVHTLIEPTVAAMLAQLRAVEPCDCDECNAMKGKA